MEHHDDEIWFVQLEGGAVRAMSLDELDEAWSAGRVTESTLLRQDGSTEWTPLGVVLGVHDEATAAPARESASPLSTAAVTLAPSPAPQTASAPPPAVELDLDLEAPSFGAPKRKAAVLGGVAALGVIAALGFTAFRVSTANEGLAPSKVSAAMPQAVVAAAPVEGTADAGPRFNEEQRRLLLEADKKREAEAAARVRARPGYTPPSKPIKMGDGIKSGGSKYDPLNGAL